MEELTATIKRLELLKNNVDNPEEIVAADLMITNLTNLARQFGMLLDSPDFKEMVKNYERENSRTQN